ncbi:arginine--tRNA ligase [candidate division GN15 bacterium]|nr:arginine--tRNA ligase [candidate division GN15 bacterium]
MSFKDNYQAEFARAAEKAFPVAYPDTPSSNLNAESIFGMLGLPKDHKMGRFCLPVFRFAKELKTKPPEIAQELCDAMNDILAAESSDIRCEAVGGFVNARIDPANMARSTLSDILEQGERFGLSDEGKGQTTLVEYSSCNIAKPFGIGHLRTTIIGNSLRLIFQKLGHTVVGINYLGDWGTQFGKLIVAYRLWGEGLDLTENAVEKLYGLYVRFHKEAEDNPELDEQAREAFKQLEEGNAEEQKLWERFRTLSLKEFERIYALMGIEFDWITGEAFLNDKMEPVIERFRKAGLTSISRGAEVVDLHDEQLPPLLLRKADGATLYATRDLAGLLYRWDTWYFSLMLYVVATSQSDHFKQVFKAVDLLEQAEGIPEEERASARVAHVDFGWVKFMDTATGSAQMMSTRKGNIVFLEDVIAKAKALARERILQRNPDTEDIDKTAHMIGVGAIVFSQFMAKRQKDISFDWDQVLSFEGETGPYLQYTHARLCSLLRHYEAEVPSAFDPAYLGGEEEQRVVELLYDFPRALHDAAGNFDPYYIGTHLLKLSAAFNKVYQRKDEQGKIDKIISEDHAERTQARIVLVKAVQTVVGEGLRLLGIPAPQQM